MVKRKKMVPDVTVLSMVGYEKFEQAVNQSRAKFTLNMNETLYEDHLTSFRSLQFSFQSFCPHVEAEPKRPQIKKNLKNAQT